MSIYYVSLLFIALGFNYGDAFLIPDGLQMVSTNVGEIQGHLANYRFDGKIYQSQRFLGIPYAKPPVGNLRFRKPEPLATLPQSPFKALKFGPACSQPHYAEMGTLTTSEDCLFLNVYLPSSTGLIADATLSSNKTVMVFIHGGGFFVGMSDSYDGGIVSAYNDVIVVTMNYRLGALGFFSTHDKNAPGNYGLWDQHLAIRWVYDNIGAFGGDPNNILIFGESAGSSSVVYQTLFPGNKGLVKRAIAESGTLAAWGLDRMDTNRQKSVNFAVSVGCESMGTINMTCIRSKSSDEMKNASESFTDVSEGQTILAFVPIFDNEFVMADTNSILADMPTAGLGTQYTEVFHSIDLMIGACNLDGLLYFDVWLAAMNNSIPLTGKYGFTSRQFEDIVIPDIARNVLNAKPNQMVLEAIKFEYTNWDDPFDATKRLQSLVEISTDFALNAPTILTANDHQLSSKATYVYQFATSVPGVRAGDVPSVLKTDKTSTHGDDLPYVFGFESNVLAVLGLNSTNINFTAEQIRVSKAMMAMWTNFAKTGNPNTPVDLQQIYKGLVWPEYDMDGAKYLQITPGMSEQSVKTRLAARAVQFWNNLLPEIQGITKIMSGQN